MRIIAARQRLPATSRLLKNSVRSRCERKLSAGKEHWRTLGLAIGRQAPQKSGGPHVKPTRRRPALNIAASLWDTTFFRPGRRRVAGPMQPHRAAHRSLSETKKPQVSRSTRILQQPARRMSSRWATVRGENANSCAPDRGSSVAHSKPFKVQLITNVRTAAARLTKHCSSLLEGFYSGSEPVHLM